MAIPTLYTDSLLLCRINVRIIYTRLKLKTNLPTHSPGLLCTGRPDAPVDKEIGWPLSLGLTDTATASPCKCDWRYVWVVKSLSSSYWKRLGECETRDVPPDQTQKESMVDIVCSPSGRSWVQLISTRCLPIYVFFILTLERAPDLWYLGGTGILIHKPTPTQTHWRGRCNATLLWIFRGACDFA